MIPWENLKLWYGYPLQNGVWLDLSKYDNDGTLVGARWERDSIAFDGIDDYVNCGNDTSLNISEALTVEVLMKVVVSTSMGALVDKTIGGDTNKQYLVFLWNGQGIFRIVKGGVDTYISTNTTIPVGVYCHYVAIWDGAVMKSYVNSVEQTSTQNVAAPIDSGDGDVFVGKLGNGAYIFNGEIAQVKIYNKGFTGEQVREAYEQCYRLI